VAGAAFERSGGRGRGDGALPPPGPGLGPPALARTQSCDCDRPEHNEQRLEARHDKPPFGVGRLSGDATIRQVGAAGKRVQLSPHDREDGARALVRGCFLGALTLG